MTKKFKRRPHDEYITPLEATVPLRPFLREIRTFAEPCCNQRQLVGHLEPVGPICIHSDDIQHGTDALVDPILAQLIVDAIITNPPYTWSILKAMLILFPKIAPTWLLLEADFKYRGQSAPFMRVCSDVVPIGQIRWFPGTKHKSFKHYAWYRFDAHHSGATIFHTRQPEPVASRALREAA